MRLSGRRGSGRGGNVMLSSDNMFVLSLDRLETAVRVASTSLLHHNNADWDEAEEEEKREQPKELIPRPPAGFTFTIGTAVGSAADFRIAAHPNQLIRSGSVGESQFGHETIDRGHAVGGRAAANIRANYVGHRLSAVTRAGGITTQIVGRDQIVVVTIVGEGIRRFNDDRRSALFSNIIRGVVERRLQCLGTC